MTEGPHSDLYSEFIDFIRVDIQRERLAANRRLFSVFIWCFLMPAVTTATLLILVKMGILPRKINRYVDWLLVIFPVAYGVYMLSFDAVKEAPIALRRGGIAVTLSRALQEERWRARVCEDLKAKFLGSPSETRIRGWKWLIDNFEIDLHNVQNRTRYLTALAGAVFFLIFQGIDAFDSPHSEPRWSTSSIMGWFEASSSTLTQFVGLGIFLVLLYVSGNQIYLSLVRYLQCARLAFADVLADPRKRGEIRMATEPPSFDVVTAGGRED